MVDDGRWLQNRPVAHVPATEDLDLSLSLDSLVLALTDLIHRAKESITILSPFFTLKALDIIRGPLAAAERGVEITVITRSVTYEGTENAAVLEALREQPALAEQLHVFEYGPVTGTGGTLHAKLLLIDSRAGYVGSANMTHRSLRDSIEVGVILFDRQAGQLAAFTDELLGAEFTHSLRYVGGRYRRS